MGVSPAYFREQGCCDVVRQGPVWETRGEQLSRVAGTMASKQERGWILRGRRAPELAEWEVGREGGRSGKSRTHRQVLVVQVGLLTPLSPPPDAYKDSLRKEWVVRAHSVRFSPSWRGARQAGV